MISEGIDVNAINTAGHSPLSLHFLSIKNAKGLSNLSINSRSAISAGFQDRIVDMLAKAGANFNYLYNDYKEKPSQKAVVVVEEESKDEI